jgi:hypothetical protein
MNMARLLTILFIGLIFEAIGVVLLSRGLKEISSWFFAPAEITDLPVLAAKLSRTDPVSAFIWNHLSPEEQKQLNDPSIAPTEKRHSLTRALNALLPNRMVYDPSRFPTATIPQQAQQLLARSLKGDDQIELNRLLLESTYPELRHKEAQAKIPEMLGLVGRGLTNFHVLSGVFFEALFFIALLMLMAKAEVSFVWPLTSLSFVVTTFAAKMYLHEHVSALRWSGVCLIMMGAALISWSEKNEPSVNTAFHPATSSASNSISLQ